MANLKELRGRIKSVGNIAQITRAMEMVASMKLRKVQAKALSFHPYTEELQRMLGRLAASVGADSGLQWFRKPVEEKTLGIFLITSDRGLCGSYNANVFKELQSLAESTWKKTGQKVVFWVYGRKGYTWLTRRGYEVERFFVEPSLDKMDFRSAKMVADEISKAFLAGKVDSVRILGTRFASMIRFVPTVQQFLPACDTAMGAGAEPAPSLDYLMEPDAKTLFDRLIPRYLETVMFDVMLQSLASEQASRRMAMKSATDAAVRMSKQLKKVYNRARQENITKELLDIVGGANAVQ
ncbi:MAG: synthase subunit gamma [Planctomycetota bacterium]|jgi:F-type H+-transporting ATPase subunit gamma